MPEPQQSTPSSRSCGPLGNHLERVERLWQQNLDLMNEKMPKAILFHIAVPKFILLDGEPRLVLSHGFKFAAVGGFAPGVKEAAIESWEQVRRSLNGDEALNEELLTRIFVKGQSCLSALATCGCGVDSFVGAEVQMLSEDLASLSEDLAAFALKEKTRMTQVMSVYLDAHAPDIGDRVVRYHNGAGAVTVHLSSTAGTNRTGVPSYMSNTNESTDNGSVTDESTTRRSYCTMM